MKYGGKKECGELEPPEDPWGSAVASVRHSLPCLLAQRHYTAQWFPFKFPIGPLSAVVSVGSAQQQSPYLGGRGCFNITFRPKIQTDQQLFGIELLINLNLCLGLLGQMSATLMVQCSKPRGNWWEQTSGGIFSWKTVQWGFQTRQGWDRGDPSEIHVLMGGSSVAARWWNKALSFYC